MCDMIWQEMVLRVRCQRFSLAQRQHQSSQTPSRSSHCRSLSFCWSKSERVCLEGCHTNILSLSTYISMCVSTYIYIGLSLSVGVFLQERRCKYRVFSHERTLSFSLSFSFLPLSLSNYKYIYVYACRHIYTSLSLSLRVLQRVRGCS